MLKAGTTELAAAVSPAIKASSIVKNNGISRRTVLRFIKEPPQALNGCHTIKRFCLRDVPSDANAIFPSGRCPTGILMEISLWPDELYGQPVTKCMVHS
jgi:hypothetical protein